MKSVPARNLFVVRKVSTNALAATGNVFMCEQLYASPNVTVTIEDGADVANKDSTLFVDDAVPRGQVAISVAQRTRLGVLVGQAVHVQPLAVRGN